MFDYSTEIIVRRALADKAAQVSQLGVIIPAPVFFANREEYFSSVSGLTLSGQKELELSAIKFAAVSLFLFEDEAQPDAFCPENPVTYLTYNFYIFREYERTREDETALPDAFLKKTLKSYNEFIAGIFALRMLFLGEQPILGLPAGMTATAFSLTQGEFIAEHELCRFIPHVFGHQVNLQTRIEIIIAES